MYRISFLILMLLFAVFIFGQPTAIITVSVSNIELNGSRIFVGLYDNESSFKLKSGAVDSVIIVPKEENLEVSLKNIFWGNYAVAVFQDINNNGVLDSKTLNIPVEPVGISNYPANGSATPPSFKKAQFQLRGDTLISIPLVLIKKN